MLTYYLLCLVDQAFMKTNNKVQLPPVTELNSWLVILHMHRNTSSDNFCIVNTQSFCIHVHMYAGRMFVQN